MRNDTLLDIAFELLSQFQSYLENTVNHYSYNRIHDEGECCTELGETNNGGNGITGHNETSENFEQSWNIGLKSDYKTNYPKCH